MRTEEDCVCVVLDTSLNRKNFLGKPPLTRAEENELKKFEERSKKEEQPK